MPRKVIIDCDPGIDDAVALTIALFHSEFDVLAITATEGNVSADRANRNVQSIMEQLDPPRYPRVGVASPLADAPMHDARQIHGDDGLGNTGYDVSLLQHKHASEKMICDIVRSSPGEVTIIALGPLTNVARAIKRDAQLAASIGHIIMMGGSVDGVGNVTPAAEFNTYYDAEAARTVFQSPTTKTLVPLDVTRQVVFSLDFLNNLPSEQTRAGLFLRGVMPHLYRAFRQRLGMERVYIHDAVALILALHPELFTTTEMAGDVEVNGELTRGATIFDQRANRQWRPNMEVAQGIDSTAVMDVIIRALKSAGEQTPIV